MSGGFEAAAEIRRLAGPALRGHPDSVHDLRVLGRTLRAALPSVALRPRSPAVRNARAALRDAVRVLASVRDRDVGHALLTARGRRRSSLRRVVLVLAERARSRALIRARGRWPEALHDSLLRVERLRRSPPGFIERRSLRAARRQRQRALDLLEDLQGRYRPVALHELRIRIRRLRYALERAGASGSGRARSVARLKPLQSALGDGQDRVVLARWLTRQSAQIRGVDRALSAALREEAASFRAEAREAHARFLDLRPRAVLEGLDLEPTPPASVPPGSAS